VTIAEANDLWYALEEVTSRRKEVLETPGDQPILLARRVEKLVAAEVKYDRLVRELS
jgi:hypothetical protein